MIVWLPSHQHSDQKWGHWLAQHHQPRLWLGVQRHLDADDKSYLTHCEKLAQELMVPITACGGVLMHTANRLPLQHVLTAVRHGSSVDKIGKHLLTNTERTLRSKEKLTRLFKQEWLEESVRLAEQCQFSLKKLKYEYPHELVPLSLIHI